MKNYFIIPLKIKITNHPVLNGIYTKAIIKISDDIYNISYISKIDNRYLLSIDVHEKDLDEALSIIAKKIEEVPIISDYDMFSLIQEVLSKIEIRKDGVE